MALRSTVKNMGYFTIPALAAIPERLAKDVWNMLNDW
jgi:hypothetical protein